MTAHHFNRRQFMAGAGALALATQVSAQPAAAPKQRLGVGMIGCGGRSKTHLEALQELATKDGTVEVVAVCDIYTPHRKRAVAQIGRPVKEYSDYRELLADPNVDLVCIATPDHHHGYQALDALRLNKHVYCEKPMTHWRQFDLAKQVFQAAQASKGAFQLGSQRMSDGAFHQMKKLVRDGIIGQPIYAECGIFRTGDFGERGMPIDDPNAKPGPDLNWDAFLGDSPKRDFDVSRFFRWRMYEDYAGGPVTDLYPHVLPQVLDVMGLKMPSKVAATGGIHRFPEREVPDSFSVLIEYPEKATVAVLGTQGSSYQGTGDRDGVRIPVLRGWDGALTIQGEEIVYIPDDEVVKNGRKEQRFPIEHGHNMLFLLRNLVDNARNGTRDLDSGPELSYHTHVPLLMAMESFRTGKTILFDPEKQEMRPQV